MDVENLIPQKLELSLEELKFFLSCLESTPEPPSEYSLKAAAAYRLGRREGDIYYFPDEVTGPIK